jgi:hypothetical protein
MVEMEFTHGPQLHAPQPRARRETAFDGALQVVNGGPYTMATGDVYASAVDNAVRAAILMPLDMLFRFVDEDEAFACAEDPGAFKRPVQFGFGYGLGYSDLDDTRIALRLDE